MHCLLGCAGDGAFLVEDPPPQDDLRSLLVLPISFDSTAAQRYISTEMFVRGTARLSDGLLHYLESCGHEVTPLPSGEVALAWVEAAEAVGGVWAEDGRTLLEDRYESARASLAERLLRRHPADGIVMAGIFVREGRYVGLHLRWDGVSRPMKLEQKNNQAYVSSTMGGDVATSIGVTVFDRAGRKIYQRYGGIEPIIEYSYVGGGVMSYSTGSFSRRNRTDLFEDDALLQDSIRVALTPLIVRPKAASK